MAPSPLKESFGFGGKCFAAVWGREVTIKALALGAAVAVLACGSAHAAVITYELTADATYTLAGVAHTGFIDIRGVGDTANLVSQPYPGSRTLALNGTAFPINNAPFAISIDLAGLGTFTVTTPSYVYDLQNGELAAFGSVGFDFIYFRTPLLDPYDMISNLAPVTGNWLSTDGSSVATTGGRLAIASYNNGQFSAHVAPARPGAGPAAAAPEPATWALMLLGFGGLGASLRYRRRTAIA